MKKILVILLKFAVPLLLLLVLIFFMPVNKKYAYAFVNKGGCEGRSSCIYRNIYEDTGHIDVAFIGTSHTMNAINDAQLEEQYKKQYEEKICFRNLAYCGLGRNFDYIIVRDLLQHKKIKMLVLEVQDEESQYGHRSFAHVATPVDLIEAPISFNRSYLPDLYKGLLLRMQYLRETVTGEDIRHEVDIPSSAYGFNGADGKADLAELYKKPRPKDIDIDLLEKGLNSYPMKYVEEIGLLAKENNVRLVLLYLPEFGHEKEITKIKYLYSRYGPVISTPSEILSNPENWYDKGHLNKNASDQLTPILVKRLKEIL